jgi:hypothetical protein
MALINYGKYIVQIYEASFVAVEGRELIEFVTIC